ncbi:unnamed protein product, partial [Strongylus vulgaris]
MPKCVPREEKPSYPGGYPRPPYSITEKQSPPPQEGSTLPLSESSGGSTSDALNEQEVSTTMENYSSTDKETTTNKYTEKSTERKFLQSTASEGNTTQAASVFIQQSGEVTSRSVGYPNAGLTATASREVKSSKRTLTRGSSKSPYANSNETAYTETPVSQGTQPRTYEKNHTDIPVEEKTQSNTEISSGGTPNANNGETAKDVSVVTLKTARARSSKNPLSSTERDTTGHKLWEGQSTTRATHHSSENTESSTETRKNAETTTSGEVECTMATTNEFTKSSEKIFFTGEQLSEETKPHSSVETPLTEILASGSEQKLASASSDSSSISSRETDYPDQTPFFLATTLLEISPMTEQSRSSVQTATEQSPASPASEMTPVTKRSSASPASEMSAGTEQSPASPASEMSPVTEQSPASPASEM